jgi:polar amino acid transport system substrate-binding protein
MAMMIKRRTAATAAALAAGLTLTLAVGGSAQPRPARPGLAPALAVAQRAAITPAKPCDDGLPPVASLAPGDITADYRSVKNSPTLKRIRERGYLTLGTSGDVLLWGATNPKNGDLEGFDVLVAAEVAKAAGVKPERTAYKIVNYGDRLKSLKVQSGQQAPAVDLVAHTMTINCARWGQGARTTSAPNPIDFSSVYYQAGQKVLIRKDMTTVRSIDDLTGDKHKICVPAASTNVDNVNALKKDFHLVPLDVVGDCLVKFQEGEVDAITGDDTVLAGFAAQDPYAMVIGDPISAEPYGMGINAEDAEFTRFVNAVLEKLRSNGRLEEIYRSTMGRALPGVAWSPPQPVYGRRVEALRKN